MKNIFKKLIKMEFVLISLLIIPLINCNSDKEELTQISNNKNKLNDAYNSIDSTEIDFDTIAIDKVTNILKKIEQELNSECTYSQLEEEILFLEKLTNIVIELDADFIGLKKIKKNGYIKYKDWFEKNKHRLYWDEKEQMVKLKE